MAPKRRPLRRTIPPRSPREATLAELRVTAPAVVAATVPITKVASAMLATATTARAVTNIGFRLKNEKNIYSITYIWMKMVNNKFFQVCKKMFRALI
jgi:hypothetical protein